MTPQYRIFYSWQSDDADASKAIGKALDKVVKQLKEDGISVYIEQGGGGYGFISIEESVRIKIRRSDIFVGDITPVGKVDDKDKNLPNANVMFEMGLATECMSPNRILAIAKEGDWKEENMPFDFNHYTMLKFNTENGLNTLYNAISQRISETSEISKNENSKFFSSRLIDRNIKSEKYLPDTFLENLDAKDHARCFISPKLMYPFIYKKMQKLSFDDYNKKKKLKGENNSFKLNLKPWDIEGKPIDIEHLQVITKNILSYIDEKIKDLRNDGNDGYIASIKLEHIREKIDAMNKKLMLITSDAGQGKTNFVCDLVSNVLYTNDIPYVFVNAYELSAELLANSIAAEYDFISNNSLDMVLTKAEKFCNQRSQYLIIVIDGLNEHPKQGIFQANLIRVLDAVRKFKHVKVIMTCRKVYYENNYKILKKELYEDLIELPLHSTQYRENEETTNDICILERYGQHFGTGVPTNLIVRRVLLNNMLLMRIFFETNKGNDVTEIDQIDYINLYQKYYAQLCEKLQQIIEQDSRLSNTKGLAQKIFHHITTWMIKNNILKNIPLEDIQKKLTDDERHCFTQFMNANIILQQDFSEESSGISEVLNFTFEQMRDFIVVRHLIEEIFIKDINTFKEKVDYYTEDNNNQAEGTKRFLFLYARSKEKKEVIEFIKKQKWYHDALIENIWDLPENVITTEDVSIIKDYLGFQPGNKAAYIACIHWSPTKYPKLNLNVLLEVLKGMHKSERMKYLEKIWPSRSEYFSHFRRPINTPRGNLLSSLKAEIKKREKNKNRNEYNALVQFEYYLSEGMEKLYVPVITDEKDQQFKTFFRYNYDSYLLKVHKGTKKLFLKNAGIKKGYAREMFGTIYDGIFAEANDVQSLYKDFFFNEYQDLIHFIKMRYSVPKNQVQPYVDACESNEFSLIDFETSNYSVRGFLMNDKLKERIYNWLNWEKQ